MAAPVVNGTFIKCSCASSQPPGVPIPGELSATANGLPPSTIPNAISVLPKNCAKCGNQYTATIQDNVVGVNIKPFQLSCKSPTNKDNILMSKAATTSATASASGVYTPMTVVMPCLPQITGPWAPGCIGHLIKNVPALGNDDKLMCMWGGVIEVDMATNPPSTVKVP